MQTIEKRLADVDAAIKRWRPRMTRASNIMNQLLRKRERLIREKVTQAVPAAAAAFEAMAEKLHEKEPSIPLEQATRIVETADTVIPEFLRRGQAAQKAVSAVIDNLPKAGDPGPQMLADIMNPASEINRRRLERMQAKRQGLRKAPKEKPLPRHLRKAMDERDALNATVRKGKK